MGKVGYRAREVADDVRKVPVRSRGEVEGAGGLSSTGSWTVESVGSRMNFNHGQRQSINLPI